MNRRQFLLTATGLGVGTRFTPEFASAASYRQAESSTWTKAAFDNKNTNRNAEAEAPNENLEILWEKNGPAVTTAQPLVTDDYIIVPAGGYVDADWGLDRLVTNPEDLPIVRIHDAESGELLQTAREPLHSPRDPVARQTNGLTFEDGTLYAVAGEFKPVAINRDRGNVVYSIDVVTGDVNWWTLTSPRNEEFTAQNYWGTPIVNGDSLAVGNPSSFRGPIDLLDKETGEIIYGAKINGDKEFGERTEGDHPASTLIAVHGDSNLVFGAYPGSLISWNAEEKEYPWRSKERLGSNVEYTTRFKHMYHAGAYFDVCIDDRRAYYVRGISVAAFRLNNGEWDWTRSGTYYKVNMDYMEYKEDSLESAGIPRLDTEGRTVGKPVLTDDAIITLSEIPDRETTYLLALDKTTGEVNWLREFDGEVSGMAGAADTLYLAVGEQLRTLNSYTGEDIGRVELDGYLSDVAVTDGKIVVTTHGPDDEFEKVTVFSGERAAIETPNTRTKTATTQRESTTTTTTSATPTPRTATSQSSASTPGFGITSTLASMILGGYYLKHKRDDE